MSRFHSSHNGENATFVKLRAWVDLGPHYHRYMTGLLHLHIRHCSSAASAVRRLPSAVRTATPAFDVRSSGLFCGRPGGLELVTRLPARSVTFLWQFLPGPENFFSRFTQCIGGFAIMRYIGVNLLLTLTLGQHTHTRLTALFPGPPGWAGIPER